MPDMDRRQFLAATGGLAAVSIFPDALPAAPVLAEPLNVGLIGIGRQGRQMLAEMAKIQNLKVAAVCDTDKQRLESAKGRAAGAAAFDNYKALLDDKSVGSVIIATPTHQHRQIAIDAVAAGKHVYCEAPLAHTIDDARAIASAAASAKTVFSTGHDGRSNPVYSLARSFYKTDAFKDQLYIRAQSNQKTTWRVPAGDPSREAALNWRMDKAVSTGMMGEIGSHQIDVVAWYRGRYPVSVRGFGSIRHHTDGREIADTVNAEFAFDDGLRFVYMATLGNSFGGRYEVLYGSNSAIKLAYTHAWMFKESDAPTQGWEVYANRQQFHTDVGITLIADATQLASQGKLKEGVGLPNPPLYYALSDFIKCIAEGKRPACSAEDGFRTAAVSILANQAVSAGKEIAIEPSLLSLG